MSERLDERLRRAARTYRRLGNHTAEGMFLEAADTICELQTENAKLREDVDRLIQAVEDLHDVSLEDSLVQMENENAKLREQIHWLKKGDILHVLTDQEYIDQCERERLMQVSIDALDKDNAKLRELVKSMYYDLTHMTFPPDWVTDYEADMRDLGVEVDG